MDQQVMNIFKRRVLCVLCVKMFIFWGIVLSVVKLLDELISFQAIRHAVKKKLTASSIQIKITISIWFIQFIFKRSFLHTPDKYLV